MSHDALPPRTRLRSSRAIASLLLALGAIAAASPAPAANPGVFITEAPAQRQNAPAVPVAPAISSIMHEALNMRSAMGGYLRTQPPVWNGETKRGSRRGRTKFRYNR